MKSKRCDPPTRRTGSIRSLTSLLCLVPRTSNKRWSILEGQSVDFGTKDRIQFAMMVVEYIEEHLPLPPFEVWLDDYLEQPETYRLYAHTLHQAGRLP